MRKFLVIYNPVSGAKNFRATPDLIKSFLEKKKIEFVWFETLAKKNQPFEQLSMQNFDRIIVVGGDGTVRELATFIIKKSIKVPMAIIPQGTGNLLATSLGIPLLSTSSALNYAVESSFKPIDAIRINEDHFALVAAGQGYDSLFISGATRTLKRKYGFFAYVLSFLRTFFTYVNKKYHISIDGKQIKTSAKLVLLLNTLSFSGIPLHKKISPHDGLLDLLILRPRTLWDLIKMLVLYPFHGVKSPKIQYFQGKEIVIKQLGGRKIQMDGEVFSARELRASIVPNALNIVYEK